MVNRVKALFDRPPEPGPPHDYWVIETRGDMFYVTEEVAARVLGDLRRLWPPRWVEFADLSGAAVRIRSRLIHSVAECRADQRQAARDFQRARRDERKADRRPWEDDDDLWCL